MVDRLITLPPNGGSIREAFDLVNDRGLSIFSGLGTVLGAQPASVNNSTTAQVVLSLPLPYNAGQGVQLFKAGVGAMLEAEIWGTVSAAALASANLLAYLRLDSTDLAIAALNVAGGLGGISNVPWRAKMRLNAMAPSGANFDAYSQAELGGDGRSPDMAIAGPHAAIVAAQAHTLEARIRWQTAANVTFQVRGGWLRFVG